MRANQKDRLTVFEPVVEADKYGSESTVWVARGTYWAERVKRSGSLSNEVGEHFNAITTEWNVNIAIKGRFKANWRVADIRDGSTLYTITNVTPNRDRGMAVVTCERVNE